MTATIASVTAIPEVTPRNTARASTSVCQRIARPSRSGLPSASEEDYQQCEGDLEGEDHQPLQKGDQGIKGSEAPQYGEAERR